MNQTAMRNRLLILLALAGILLMSLPAFAAPVASDAVTVATVSGSGTIDVPVYIRDVSGTPLGMDQPSGSRIQAYSIKVDYSPASAVQSISFTRAGITSSLTPSFESSPSSAGSISLLDSFSESTNLIPFTLNAAAPGNKVAHLTVTLSPSAVPGSSITLALDASLTQLTDAGGSAATKETNGNGLLALVNGRIDVSPLTVSLTPSSTVISNGGTGVLNVVLSGTSPTSTTVNLLSLATDVATVPASVVVPAGQTMVPFTVTAVSPGTATIRATLGSSTGSASVLVSSPNPCPAPSAPHITAAATAQAGSAYTVSWAAVSGATEYVIDESTDPTFATKSSQTVNGTSASFTHGSAGATYYYRLRARNHTSTCDVYSSYSNVASVLITEAPAPEKRILAVVGSLPGGFGSYFRTSVQLYNSRDTAISGMIVFHPANASGSSSDPSLPYSLAPGKTISYSDLLPAMGVTSGIGTVDLIADGTSAAPVALARVFNDGGASGTTGLAEEGLAPADALKSGKRGVLLGPADPQHFRLNIGVRSLEQGASITFTVRDKDGAVVKTASRTYDPTFFSQTDSATLLGYELTGGETISVEVTSGSAFVYGSTTDNTTNDPSVQLARSVD